MCVLLILDYFYSFIDDSLAKIFWEFVRSKKIN